MSTFGIKVISKNNRIDYFVGQDSVLFDWLRAADYEPSDIGGQGKLLIVRSPEGYAFHHRSSLVMVQSEEVREIYGSSIGNKGYVMASSPQTDKLQMIFHLIQHVSLEELEALNVVADRILDVEFS